MRKNVENVRDFDKSFKNVHNYVKDMFLAQFQRFCVKMLDFSRLRGCMKMEKNLRDLRDWVPPGGPHLTPNTSTSSPSSQPSDRKVFQVLTRQGEIIFQLSKTERCFC